MADEGVNYIADLNTGKDNWKLRVRILKVWDEFAEQFLKYVVGLNKEHHVVIILQFGRIRNWQVPSFQNNLFGSKLFIDDNVEEISDFRKRFMCTSGCASTSQGGSQLSTQRVHSVREDFLTQTKHCTIDEIVDTPKPRVCIVAATITSIPEHIGWFYIACRKHKTKAVKKSDFVSLEDIDSGAEGEDDGGLYCRKCKGKARAVFLSFKVQIRVQDSTGSTSFVLFDKDMYKLVHKQASDLIDKQHMDGTSENFPEELKDLVDKKWLFKVEVSKYNIDHGYQVYTVLKVCSTPDIISAFMGLHPDDQDGDENCNFIGKKTDVVSNGCVPTKDVVSSTDDASIGVDQVDDSAATPASKRCKYVDDKDCVGEMPTSKKRVVSMKIEKP